MPGHSPPMATKTEFTEQEWKALQGAVTGAGLWVASVDRGFLDTFKEASALAHHLRDAHEKSDSALVRDIAGGTDRPFGMTASPTEMEQATTDALREALAALEAKSAQDVPVYKRLILDVAESVANAAKGVSASENEALARIKVALAS
jgi:hypothetical protein